MTIEYTVPYKIGIFLLFYEKSKKNFQRAIQDITKAYSRIILLVVQL